MTNMFRIDGKVAVIIGGGGAIGGAVAAGMAEQGAKVVIASRSMQKLQDMAKKIEAEIGVKVAYFSGDAKNEESIIKLAGEIVSTFGTIDILVNAYGSATKKPADEFPADVWDSLFDLNVKGVMFCCREFGKTMIKNKRGKIINLSSVRGSRATLWGGNLGYCASKGALDMLTRALASEWAQYNINVNAVAPSLVAKPEVFATRSPEQIERYLGNVPLKRVADPKEVAGAFVFLACPASDFITGQIIYLDGGMTAIG
jgi:NAD(P)-dependent dehydrogenase (short-subunit alcohol dehydrogenase family)